MTRYDVHILAGFMDEPAMSDETLTARQNIYGLYKTDRHSVDSLMIQWACAGIDRAFLLPLDLTTTEGMMTLTNDEVAAFEKKYPDKFVGFCSVDPARDDAAAELERAFSELKLHGLKLHPSKQRFYADDDKLEPLYEICERFDKPIMFHAGMPASPDAPSWFSRPEYFEKVAYEHPKLRICLCHFGWPWVQETCMLMLKYRNVYTDTAALYFDNPAEFYGKILGQDMGKNWLERSFRHQVMFGSEEPRLEQIRMARALRGMGLRESTLELIFGGNAEVFLGGK